MKDIKEKYEPVETGFLAELKEHAEKRRYIPIHYFNEIHEYIPTTAIIKAIVERQEEAYLELSTGEEVRLDWIVRVDGKQAPGYTIEDFTCDC